MGSSMLFQKEASIRRNALVDKRSNITMNDSQRNITKSTWPVSIPVAISSRHVHLTQAMIERLFGDKYRLHVDSALNQPHQYLAMETVTLVGPYGRIRNVCVIGPARSVNQVEISRTDAITLGTKAPVRESGDLIGSPGIVIEGPRAEVQLGTGVICAFRHIHMSPAEAERLVVKDRDRVEVSTEVYNRRMLFRDVLVRVSPDYQLELHLDTDEANAAGLRAGDFAVLRKTGSNDLRL
jgi:acetate kinase